MKTILNVAFSALVIAGSLFVSTISSEAGWSDANEGYVYCTIVNDGRWCS